MSAVLKAVVPADIDEVRYAIDDALEEGLLAPVETQLRHFHTDELYGRWIEIPAGAVFTTYVHKIDHISVALKGRITIIDQDGTKVDVTGPDAFVTRAGTQRVVYVHEDITFMTIHPCLEKDNDKVTDVLGCKTMGEYNSMKLLEN